MNDEMTSPIETINETFSESTQNAISQFTVVQSPYKCRSVFDQISRFSVNDQHEILLQCENYLCFINAEGEYLYSFYQYDLNTTQPYFRYRNDHRIEMYYPATKAYLLLDAQGNCLEMRTIEDSQNLEQTLNIHSGYISKFDHSHTSCTVDGFTYRLNNTYTGLIKINEATGDAASVFQIDNAQHVIVSVALLIVLVCIFVFAIICGSIRIIKQHKLSSKNSDHS